MRNGFGERLFLLLATSCVACMALIMPTACRVQQSTWERVQAEGVLHFGLDPTYPPFEFTDGNMLQGIDVDLAEALASELGVGSDFSHFGYDGLYDALLTKQVDVLISALVADPARTKDFSFSEGYINGGLVLVSRSEAPFSELSELTNTIVAVELGAEGHVQATTWQRKVPDLTIDTQVSSEEALAAVHNGQADVAIVDNITARLYSGSHSRAGLNIASITYEPYVLVVRSDDDKLLAEIDRSLASLRESGRIDAILDRWLKD